MQTNQVIPQQVGARSEAVRQLLPRTEQAGDVAGVVGPHVVQALTQIAPEAVQTAEHPVADQELQHTPQ